MKSASAVVASRNTIPILANVLLRTTPGSDLELVTTDLDCEYRQRIACGVDGDLATTVDARRLTALLGTVEKGARISLSPDGHRLIARAGRARWTLPALPVDDFPVIAGEMPQAAISLPGKDLARHLRRVAWAVADDVTRYYLCGVLFNPEAGKLALAAANGHCCIQDVTSFDWPEGAPDALVPTKAVQQLIALGEAADRVTIAWDNRHMRATAGEVTFTSKLIDGAFPEYRRIIPAEVDQPASFDPAAIIRAARATTIVASGKTRSVKLSRQTDLIRVEVVDNEGGTACEEVPASTPERPETGVNAQYLIQALDALGGETVELHHAHPGAPMLFRRAPADGARVVVMPMRV
jgi:DNA polymerase-3 subunit beta